MDKMSMSMEPENCGLYEEMDSGGEGECSSTNVDSDRAAATLMVSHTSSGEIQDSLRGPIPGPFRSATTSNYRQYNPSKPSMLSTSGST